MNLSTSVEKIPRIGPQYQKKLKKLGIKTVRELLFHFPHRYEDFSTLTPISEVKIGGTVCIQGKILEIKNTITWKRRMVITEAIVEDDSGAIKVIWFNQPYLIDTLKPENLVCLAGKVALGKKSYPGIYLSSPSYEKISDAEKKNLIHTGGLIPVYPETEGLSSRWLRYILRPLLAKFKKEIKDSLPELIKKEESLLPLNQALWQIHFPDSKELAKKARKRFSFQELFFIQLNVLREKMRLKMEKAISIPFDLKIVKSFVDSLPFKLTNAQRKSAWQILKDIEKPRPMNRLLEGDVGSGKTIVATIAALNVAKAEYQVAFMAPTEILAEQHFKNLKNILKDFKLKIGLLTGSNSKISEKKITKKTLLQKIKEGEIDIIIGTHALIQEEVRFGKLALVILDEQHRFGVEQRARLCQGADSQVKLIPHLLSMTATPIPRTLALTLYGDLDLSLLDEMPKGRKKIITKVIPPKERERVYDFIKDEVKKGKQVFVICPRIESTETSKNWSDVKAVKKEYEKLSKKIFPKLKVAMLHGKMKSKEKEEVMKKMKNKKIDVLVSTSVIEVGIDIPNATLMLIEGADKFGLSQLHQFRGRVGRREDQSFCFLFTDSGAKKTRMRLRALLDSKTGFELAEKDLQIRGPGEVFGARQWGIPDLAMSSLSDVFLVEKTRSWAQKILQQDPQLKKYPLLADEIKEFGKIIHLE
ncbi:MAG: ATP-dependent DNA helicase RecG [Candidatus Nealsonbacteria bacterium]|nr:MAG: ATP-dependent DNA helicase RecG [Candidatus Nealsonbacteria bacterium]